MKFKTLLAAVALAGSAGISQADTVVTLTPTGPGMFAGGFTQAVDGLFVDTFSFIPASFAGLVSVSLASLSGPVSFFVGSLNGQDFSSFEPAPASFAFSAYVSADMPLTLTVFGAVLDADGNPGGAGSYRGVITAAVPEPQTWALMLAGLAGLAGLSAAQRRRRAGAFGLPPPERAHQSL